MEKYAVDPSITKAKTLHTDFYTDAIIFQQAKEKLFSSWQFIGDSDTLMTYGNCSPLTLLPGHLDEPLLLTKDSANELHCLSNVCTHRGNLLITEPCQAAHIRCRYHGRLFGLHGRFQSMPEFKDVEDFPSADDNLPELPLLRWGKLLFTALQPQTSVNPFAEMMQRLHWLPLDHFRFRPDLSKTYTVKAHWALYCENYLEGFHIPFVHAGLNAVIDYGSYTTELFRYSNLQLGIAKEGEEAFDLPSSSPDNGKMVAAYYFWVFPNMMFNFYPWGLSINVVNPVSIDSTKVFFYTYLWNESKYNRGAGSELDKVEMEDEAVVEAVQKGVRSSLYKHGRYSVTREQGIHHFHRLISEHLSG
jgi:choline monooxygenase